MTTQQPLTDTKIETQTLAWVQTMVVGLNLCPFAQAALNTQKIRVQNLSGVELEACLEGLATELLRLVELDDSNTSLVVLADGYADFHDYLDFVAMAEALLEQLGLVGEIQIATFHPDYQFEGEPFDDPANFSNRSPHPMLHLLKESAVEKAVAHFPDVDAIPSNNVENLRTLGLSGIRNRLEEIGHG